MLSSLVNCVNLLLIMSQLCAGFPVIPEVASSPSRCLHRAVDGPYCWYILKNNRQVNGGLRLLSNDTGVKSFSSIELSAGLEGQRPINVAVWANEDAAYKSFLIGNISLELALHIPLFSKTGPPIKGGWEIDFPASLSTTVDIPYIGSATGTNGTQATAVVYNNSNARLVLAAQTATSGNFVEAKCELTVVISSEDLVTNWHYEAYASIDAAGRKEGYNVHYINKDLLIFYGSLK